MRFVLKKGGVEAHDPDCGAPRVTSVDGLLFVWRIGMLDAEAADKEDGVDVVPAAAEGIEEEEDGGGGVGGGICPAACKSPCSCEGLLALGKIPPCDDECWEGKSEIF